MPQAKKLKNNRAKFNPLKIVALVIPVAVIAIVVFSLADKPAGKTPVVSNSDLVIPLSEVSETAAFYPVEIDGTQLEVLAVQAPDGSVRTAFNTCQVCYSSGKGYYVQEGDVLVCQNCGNRFRMDDVEVTRGGCNPVPIAFDNKNVNDDSITISKEFLAQAKVIFANWKN